MNNEITYISEFRVLINKRQIGTIKELYDNYPELTLGRPGRIIGYRYFPKGDKSTDAGGEIFPTLMACKNSLEAQ